MRAIIIGAGRGRRLMPATENEPKCFARVQGRRILDWTLHAFTSNRISDICFIGGYQIQKVQETYPQLTFRHNRDWETNNILESLMRASDLMDRPFLCCYSDILFTPQVVARLLAAEGDLALAVDTSWLQRYQHRTLHPPNDAEKVIARNGRVIRVHRDIDPAQAHGEFIGLARFSQAGAALLQKHYLEAKQRFSGQPFREAKSFEQAYLIHLFQHMIEAGVTFHHVDTPGEYMEIDTQQDFDLAQIHWNGSL